MGYASGSWRGTRRDSGACCGNPGACIEYLAPYVFKVAISDQRILRVDDSGISLRWRKVGSNRPRTLTLDGS